MLIPFVALAVLHLVAQGADARASNSNRPFKTHLVHSGLNDEVASEITAKNVSVLDTDPRASVTEVSGDESLVENGEEILPSEPIKFGVEEDPNYDNVTCSRPPQVKGVKTRVQGEEHDIGTVAIYRCDYGYVHLGPSPIQSTCELDVVSGRGRWSNLTAACIKNVTCNRPPHVKGARTGLRGQKHHIGTKAYYRCYSGYSSQGFDRIQSVCEYDEESETGRWSEPTAICIDVSCNRPPQVKDGRTRLRGEKHRIGTKANYSCEYGYVLQGSSIFQSVCEYDEESGTGRWSDPTAACIRESDREPEPATVQNVSSDPDEETKDSTENAEVPGEDDVTCDRPPPVEGAIAPRMRENKHALGTVVTYRCDFGFVSRGYTTFQSECEKDELSGGGRWSVPNIDCIPRSCGDPGFVMNGHRIGSVFTFPNTVEFECEDGYKLNGAGVRYCQASGVWSGKLPTCEQVYCDRPRNPENGRVRYIALEYGTELRYECNKGFILSNHQQRYCTENGTWSNEEPVCIEANCNQPQAPENGFLQLTNGLKVDSLVIYSCAGDKTLVGTSTSKCLIDGQWTFPPPKCVDPCKVRHVENGEIGRYEKRGYYKKVFIPFEDGKKMNPGEKVILRCDKDFMLEGLPKSEIEVTCEGGIWSAPLRSMQCKSDPCKVHHVENGEIGRYEKKWYNRDAVFVPFEEGMKRNQGEKLILRCDKDFVLEEGLPKSETEVTCEGGIWSVPLQCKSVSCHGDPPSMENGTPVIRNRTHGHTIYYTCDKFYFKAKTGDVECKYGIWKGPTPVCSDGRCYTNQLNFPGLVKPNEDFIAPTKDFAISCEEGYEVVGEKTKISCQKGKWNIDYNPCTEESQVRCPEIDERGIYIIRYNNHKKVKSAVHYYCKDRDRKILDSNFRTCQENGEWSGVEPECVESHVRCPEIDERGIFNIHYNNGKDVNSVAHYSCKNDREILGSNSRTCQENGEWSGVDPECVGEGPPGVPTTTASDKRPQNAIPEPSIAELQGRDACFCTFNYLNNNVSAYADGIKLQLGSKVKKGDTVQISCLANIGILQWPNRLRAAGLVNLSCDTCQAWDERDIPSCIPLNEGDTWILWNPQMKLLPGGIAEIRQNENVLIQCSTSYATFTMRYPEWRSSPPKSVKTSHNGSRIGRKIHLNTFLDFHDFKSELTGQYECYAEDLRGRRYETTILDLKMATPDFRCPFLDEKDIFTINYSNSRKVDSIAVYFCKKQTQGTTGERRRTCMENGEWTGTEPSCVDIICPKFASDKCLSLSYTKEQYVGSVAQFNCSYPQILNGKSTSTCLENGAWSHSQPTCELPPNDSGCPEIDKKDIFIINYSNRREINSAAYYTCRSISQKVHGLTTRYCKRNGEWSGSDPVCVDITCRGFTVSGSLTVSYSKENKMGSIATFYCKPPAVLVGSFIARCLENGTWSKEQPSCVEEEVRCPEIDDRGIFTVNYNNDRKVDSNAYYYCKDQNRKISGSNVRTCQENGKWSGVDPECVAPRCQLEALIDSLPLDVVPSEENVTGDLLPQDFELNLLCDNNKILTGSNKAKCNQQGRWNIGNVQCVSGCTMDSSNSSPALIIEPVKDLYRFGEFAVFSCLEGFELTTEVERMMCMGSNGWSDPLPDCKKKLNKGN